jgi:glycosyltransferase involved in cell wall biosynthesis
VSADLRVLICNERFLPRFGLDRILLLFAEHIAGLEMIVSLACLRYDQSVLGALSSRVQKIDVPFGKSIVEIDRIASDAVLRTWELARPRVLVTGGWPFFRLAATAPSLGVSSLFVDAGAVPHDGLTDPAIGAQREVRFLREAYLPYVSLILPISEFIRFSQSEPDRGSNQGIKTVTLGADHLENPLVKTCDGPAISGSEQQILDEIDVAISDGRKHILALGRFEGAGYKNSPAIFEIFGKVSRLVPNSRLIILAGPELVTVPPEIRSETVCLQTLSDSALTNVMKRCELGISVSLWEGFNLPLGEMQWLDKPALAFVIGAHPEVVVDPWFLCASREEMTQKAVQILRRGPPSAILRLGRYDKFRERFRWLQTLNQWACEVEQLGASTKKSAPQGNRQVFVDVTNSSVDPGNSGVIRVTRRLCAHLADRNDIDLAFVAWSREQSTYTLLSPAQQPFLSSNAGPYDWLGGCAAFFQNGASPEDLLRGSDPRCSLQPILFFPEVMLDGNCDARMAWARARGFRTACIFYDMLPISAPEHVSYSVKSAFPAYVDLVRRTDAIWAISKFSLKQLERYCETLPGHALSNRAAVWLPGQFGNFPRTVSHSSTSSETINILCVSTFEPRKNHMTLIEAFNALRARRPDLPISLRLVGNRYAGAESLFEKIQQASNLDKKIVLLGNITDSLLAPEYERAAFTVYPSLIEGFGLPVLESLWMGSPCICNAAGVMSELAGGGGCLTVDMRSSTELSDAIERLATDRDFLVSLKREAMTRQIPTWKTYSDQIAAGLLTA